MHKIRLFALEYVRDFNGARAAIAAGWSPKGAKQRASELFDDPVCQAEIERVMKQRENRSRVKAFKVLDNLAPIMESNVDHYIVDNDGHFALAPGAPEDAMLAVASVKHRITQTGERVERTVEFKLWDKNTALGNAMKHLGMLKDRVEVTGANGGAITQELVVRFVRPEPTP